MFVLPVGHSSHPGLGISFARQQSVSVSSRHSASSPTVSYDDPSPTSVDPCSSQPDTAQPRDTQSVCVGETCSNPTPATPLPCATDKVSSTTTDAHSLFTSTITIHKRGQSTLYASKAQYSIGLVGEYGEESKASILGLHPDSKWILYGSSADGSLLRNKLGFDLFRRMGHWSSDTRYVELFLLPSRLGRVNADHPMESMYPMHYQGVYILEEKISRGKHRVNVEKPYEKKGVEAGGFIFSVDKPPVRPSIEVRVKTNSTFSYVVKYPSSITLPEIHFLEDHLSTVENALASPNFTDPETGYRSFLDVDTFIDQFLLNEFSRNCDAYRLSSFYSLEDRDKKIKAGPIWDMDRGWGGDDPNERSQGHEGWLLYDHIQLSEWPPLWWERMLQDPWYTDKLNRRWSELRKGVFSLGSLQAQLANSVDTLAVGDAMVREWRAWSVGVTLMGHRVWYTSPTDRLDQILSWMRLRLEWMDAHIVDLPLAPRHNITEHPSFYYNLF
eukprot:TRINITY_DN4077_c0_g1_i1.p1 TRINITY_DN4077_c0_g1~~TRINITY_DN4077_c0_g1_i1.p1  ORF type:complete len:563 (-),score=135.37 TRINITY_DN4077_c0_g1_i1:76-1572(-)